MRLIEQIQSMSFPAPLPATLLAVEQRFDAPRIDDVAGAVAKALRTSGLLGRVQPGATVAICAGSRGIRNLPVIVRAAVEQLRAVGARPFVIPAMGSHGGATAEGQRDLLARMGVTPENVGAEIRATMEAVEIGRLPGGPTLYQDANAAAADHTLLIGRVKPHTDFHGAIESGLAKMCVIGMGKQRGATEMHRHGAAGFQRFLAPAARIYEAHTNVIGGLAIIENAYDETADIQGLTAAEVGGPREMALLERARALMARLPYPEIDILVLREIGKNVSGTGMDTNIVGRIRIPRQPEPSAPDIAVITVLDLSAESHGNAAGIGLANITTARVANKIDWVATYTNSITSGIFGMWRVGLPITMADDRRALQVAMRGCGEHPEAARLVMIEDTLRVARQWVSPSLRAEIEQNPQLTITGEAPLDFAPDGTMLSPWQMA